MSVNPQSPKSLSENEEGFCLGEKGSIGKARGGSRPAAVCDRQATPPAGPSLPIFRQALSSQPPGEHCLDLVLQIGADALHRPLGVDEVEAVVAL